MLNQPLLYNYFSPLFFVSLFNTVSYNLSENMARKLHILYLMILKVLCMEYNKSNKRRL